MIVDSSALVAIAAGEPLATELLDALVGGGDCRISAATWLEASVVIDARRDPVASRRFEALVEAVGLRVEPVTESQARIGRQAYRDFGRGSGHPAKLNFGDCFSYALATERREPLLYVGEDFVHTDVRSALET